MRAIRFKSPPDALASFLCPPYDSITAGEASRLRKNPLNAVHLELPEGESAKPYEAAARTWRRWRKKGVLEAEDGEGFYVLEENFFHGGRRLRRLGLLAALGIAGRDARALLPHERTIEAPVLHRLRLLEAARANTSPIFSICPDPGGRILKLLKEISAESAPVVKSHAEEEAEFKLWRVPESPVAARLRRLLARQKAFIADGHHRLEAARRYHAEVRTAASRAVLAGIYPGSQKSLVVLAAHRVVGRALQGRARGLARLVEMPSMRALLSRLRAEKNPYAFGLWDQGFHLGIPRDASGCRTRLSVEWVGRRLLRGMPPSAIRYLHDPAAAAAMAGAAGGAAVFVKPPTLRGLFRAARGGLLPQKSTYFTPKIPTGILFREIR